jgi:hypothetical protein
MRTWSRPAGVGGSRSGRREIFERARASTARFRIELYFGLTALAARQAKRAAAAGGRRGAGFLRIIQPGIGSHRTAFNFAQTRQHIRCSGDIFIWEPAPMEANGEHFQRLAHETIALSAKSPERRATTGRCGDSRKHGTSRSMTLANLNGLSPADANATPWVATPDGSWTRLLGADVNPGSPPPPKEARRNAGSH